METKSNEKQESQRDNTEHGKEEGQVPFEVEFVEREYEDKCDFSNFGY